MIFDEDCEQKPQIQDLNSFGGNVEKYFSHLSNLFEDEFFNKKISFNNKQVQVSEKREEDGKLERFWHIISNTNYSNQKKTYPNMERCNAVFYIPVLLKQCRHCKNWLTFVHEEKNKERTYIWCLDTNIMIVLQNLPKIYRFITCFIVEGRHNKEKYKKRFDQYQKKLKIKTATQSNRS